MKKRLLFLILPIITLILEILPYGAVCNFGNPDVDSIRVTYSYFNLLPFGYANVTPFITAILSCIILALLIIYAVTGKESLTLAARIILAISAVCSLGALMFGISYFTVVGALITISLICELVLLCFTTKPQKK